MVEMVVEVGEGLVHGLPVFNSIQTNDLTSLESIPNRHLINNYLNKFISNLLLKLNGFNIQQSYHGILFIFKPHHNIHNFMLFKMLFFY